MMTIINIELTEMNNNKVDITTKVKSDAPADVLSAMKNASNYQESDESEEVQERREIMGFIDNNPVHNISMKTGDDPTQHLETFQDASLDSFFERPIIIYDGSWTVGAHKDLTLFPWNAYFENPAVERKLDNYHMMRANLHVKIMINGSPFHYSRLLVSYEPLFAFNGNHGPHTGTPGRALYLAKMSMAPHGFVDPCVQSPLEMELPFISPLNYIEVEDMADGGTVYSQMGALHFASTAVLEAVSATAASSLTMTVMAWATEVELVIPTNNIISSGKRKKMSSSSQRGSKKVSNGFNGAKNRAKAKFSSLQQVTIPPDEEKDGIVSSVSSVVAGIAGRLTDVPFIGDTAKMVKGAANGLTTVARFFGFSRPPIITDTVYVKRKPLSSIAHTTGNETIEKLTFDPKQSITIDPGATGTAPEDELSIKMFTAKETLISTLFWANADAQDAELFWINVTPNYSRQESVTDGTRFIRSSLAFASAPFKYWSGSLVYRFQFVASAYHTGRVRITYEPNGAAYSSTNYNTTYSQIVDLGTDTDISFVVPWAQTRAYKDVESVDRNEFFIPPAGIKNYNSNTSNGIVYLTVLNKLISPDVLKDVSINVFVSAGPDFELMVPNSDGRVAATTFTGPLASSGVGNSSLEPAKIAMLFGDTLSGNDIVNKQTVFFGESVTSFRSLLKRYEYVGTRVGINSNDTSNFVISSIYTAKYPPHRGAIDNTTVTNGAYTYGKIGIAGPVGSYNFNNTSLINYLSASFVGTRGSVRWKVIPATSGGSPFSIKVVRDASYNAGVDLTATAEMSEWYDEEVRDFDATSPSHISAELTLYASSTWTGGQVHPGRDGQMGVEIELPWYNNLRFVTTDIRRFGSYSPTIADNANDEIWRLDTLTGPSDEVTYIVPCHEQYVAAGEDLTFLTYMGPPYTYVQTGTVNPVD